MPKLTDTDLVILSAAARRGDRAALPLPKALGIKGEAATRTARRPAQEGTARRKAHRAQGRRMARKQRRSAHDAGHHRVRAEGDRRRVCSTAAEAVRPGQIAAEAASPGAENGRLQAKGSSGGAGPSGRAQSRPCWSIS